MNEITRIHLAKVPYNIEVEAKKALQKYLEAIESYAGDSDLVGDVESRMVEILAERKVFADGTITADDVSALKQQLGEPEEFSADDQAETVSETVDGKSMHRLYRDTTQSWFGGVAAGIARYYGIQALWIRLIFIALALVSFGSVALIYVILWIVIPPVRTAADLLQLEGKPATVTAIRNFNEQGRFINVGRDRKIARFFSVFFGTIAVLTAASTLIGAITLVTLLAHNNFAGVTNFMGVADNQSVAWIVFGFVVGGILLFATLMALVAYMLLSQRYTRRIIVSTIVVMVLGLASVATVGTLVATSRIDFQQQLDRSMVSKTYNLPTGFAGVDNLSVTSNNVDSVSYIVTDSNPRIVVDGLPGTQEPAVTVGGKTASIKINDSTSRLMGYYRSPSVKIYGPALGAINLLSGGLDYGGSSTSSSKLVVSVTGGAQLAINDLQLNLLQADIKDQSALDATGGAIRDVVVNITSASHFALANIASLSITAPDVCANGNSPVVIDVANVNNGSISYNGSKIDAKSFNDACAELNLGE